MIEAVSSTVSNAPIVRGQAEQASQARSFASNPDRIQEVPKSGLSLSISVDLNFDKAILQIRDVETGDVITQIPTESQLKAFQRAEAARQAQASTIETDESGSSQSVDITVDSNSSTATAAPAPQEVEVQQGASSAQSAPITAAVNIEA